MPTILTPSDSTDAIMPSVSVKEPHSPISGHSQKPRYRSKFGGLWTDLSNAMEVINGKLSQGLISQLEAQRLRDWIINGYVIIENAVPHDVIDRVIEDTESAWKGVFPSIMLEHFVKGQITFSPACPELRTALGKLLDLYSVSEAAREAVFAQPIRDFLKLVFDRPPLAFQSLSFMAGTGQPIH